MQIKPINYVDIENLPFEYDPDKNPYNKAFGLKRTSKVIYYPPTYKTLKKKKSFLEFFVAKCGKKCGKNGNCKIKRFLEIY